MVRRVMGEFENHRRWQRINYSPAPMSLLVEPHGGCLVNREALGASRRELQGLKTLVVNTTDLMDCAQIASGMYSPLRGFMTREELTCVLQTNRLPSGHAWTMPIVLQVDEADSLDIVEGDRIALTDCHGRIYATQDVSEIFTYDFDELTREWFGTTSLDHPGVARVARGGQRFVAGDITLVDRLVTPYQRYELSPAQTRLIFAQKGWSKVVGFHTRNVPHRVHEFIQVRALEEVHADGLYISPVVGPKKAGDFLPSPILKSYQLLLETNVYPPGKVVLGAFSTYSRYCGPREAVFTAICRKNLGCSHFIVGRDHAGVAGYYNDDQTRKLFDSLEGLGVTPIFFEPFGFNSKTQQYNALNEPETLAISGTKLRAALLDSEPLPDWYVRDNVQALLRDEIANNRPVFFEHEAEMVVAR
jgi:ATP sulfurylase